VGERILYATDLRGQARLYRQLLFIVGREDVKTLILGGSLFAYQAGSDLAEKQRQFLERTFIPVLDDILDVGDVRVLIHPGNQDLRHPTLNAVRKWTRLHPHRAELIDDGLFKMALSVSVSAYPYVPPTPCPVKDWEKWDDEQSMSIPSSFLEGMASAESGGLAPVMLSSTGAADTMRGDLEARALGLEQLRFVFVCHAPPSDTGLDLHDVGEHAGSKAVRAFLERTQPLVSLHGHLSESPRLSNKFAERIGNTLAVNPGQVQEGEDGTCSYVVFDIDDPIRSMRHSLYGVFRED